MCKTLRVLAVAALGVAAVRAGEIDLRVTPTHLSVPRGKQANVKATITNGTHHDITLVLPGDGSAVSLRTPIVGWSLLPRGSKEVHPSDPPPGEPRGYADMNPLEKSEVFTLHPGESRSFHDWLGWPSDRAPGRYRAVLYYINDPKKSISGSLLGKNQPGVEALIGASTPCKLMSNEITVEIAQ